MTFTTSDIEEDKLKFYITSCSFGLCNSACSSQSLDQVGLRKWGLTVLGIGAYLTHPCPALYNFTTVLLFTIAQPLQTRKPT